jgi:autophagy-related protein 13
MPSDEDDNLRDFIRLLEEKKELKSFNRAHLVSSEPSMRRTTAELSKYRAMRDSTAEVSESISSSLLHSSSSSSEQASSDPLGIAGTRDSNLGSTRGPLSMTDVEVAPLGAAVTVSRHQGNYI